jgi:PAS domain S-box-containing protein
MFSTLVVLLAALAGAAGARDERPPSRQRQILLIFAVSRLLPAVVEIDRAFRAAVKASPEQVYFHTEYLDPDLLSGEAEEDLGRLLRRKYGGTKLDLVVPAGSAALRFAVRHRDDLFHGSPIVFVSVDRGAAADVALGPDVTGVWLTLGWARTVDIALRLQPDLRRVVIPIGTAATDTTWRARASEQLASYRARVAIEFLTGLSLEDTLRSVASLPDRTAVVLGPFQRDGTGREMISAEATAQIGAASRVPSYGIATTQLTDGVVGGHLVSFEAQGARAAELALAVLGGRRPPPVDTGTTVDMFDWRQLRRWGLHSSRLPSGSIVQFREVSVWDRYRWHILGGVTLLCGQTTLIATLVVQRAKRRRAQEALSERLRFETLLAELSARFIDLPTTALGREIEHGLRRIGEQLDLDQASLVELGADRDLVHFTHAWTRRGTAAGPPSIAIEDFPWVASRLLRGRIVRFSRPDELEDEDAALDRRNFLDQGTRSIAIVPLTIEGAVVGALSFNTVHHERSWSRELLDRLQLVARIFANALARRRAETAIRESEDRFRLMADHAPLIVWLCTPDGRACYHNRHWIEFTGRRPADELGNGWMDHLHPDDREPCLQAFRTALAVRAPLTSEYRVRRQDGEYRYLLDHAVPRVAPDGTFSGYVGAAIDVTDIKTARQTMQESHALRSAIFGSLYGPVAAIDRDGVIIAVNESWTRFAQDNGGDVERVGVGASYVEVCRRAAAQGSEDAARALEAICLVLHGGELKGQIEYACHAPQKRRWFAMAVEPFRREEGGAVISHVEITALRESEDALRRSHVQIRDLARQLLTAQEEERRRISRELHDDLNQKVAALAIVISTMRRRAAPRDPALVESLDALQARILGLADDVRRLSHELHPAVLEHAGLSAALRTYCAELRADGELAVHLELPSDLSDVPFDVALCLYRVTQEALRNTARHSGAQAAEVTVRTDGDGVTLTVRDGGSGFDVAAERHSGLGLVSMNERVRVVGGTVDVSSAPGAGTEIVVQVPLGRAV